MVLKWVLLSIVCFVAAVTSRSLTSGAELVTQLSRMLIAESLKPSSVLEIGRAGDKFSFNVRPKGALFPCVFLCFGVLSPFHCSLSSALVSGV
jgi:hypothetical protein